METLQYERERMALGDELKALRKSKKLRGLAVAQQAGISQSKLSKIETGAVLVSAEDLRRLLGVLKTSRADAKRLMEWAQALRTEFVSWRFVHRKGFAASQVEAARVEEKAIRVRILQTSLIPGLLQIPPYIQQVVNLSNITGQSDLDRAVALRIRRQQILYEPQRRFEFLITESAALSRFCDPLIAIQQLDRLRFIDGIPNIAIGFISNEVVLPRVPQCSFVVFDSSSAIVETVAGEIATVDEQNVALYNRVFDDFSSVAVFGSRADAFLERCKLTLAALAPETQLT